MQLLRVTAEGLGRPVLVPLGALPGCPRAAADASGAAVVAGATEDALRVALREPGGGGFGAPVTLAAARDVFDLSVAVSPHGDAVVAWAEWDAPRARVRMARRDAGGTFGVPTDVVPWRVADGSVGVLTGMTADGETVLLVREPEGDGQRGVLRTGARGVPLGARVPLPQDMSVLALGVGHDGRVALAATSGASVFVLERVRGADLGPAQRVTDPLQSINARQMTVAFGADGRTAVAWHDDDSGATGAVVRDGAAGGFGPPVVIVPEPKESRGFSFGIGPPVVGPLAPLQAAVAPDGRVSVAWAGGDARLVTLAPNVVVERRRLGSRLRDPAGLSLLTLPDGRRALAWINRDGFDEDAPGRTHYAVEGTPPAPEPAAPKVTVKLPRERALRPGQRLVLPVRCSSACDLRVTLPGKGAQPVERSLTRAGTVDVELRQLGQAIAPVRPGPVRITVRSSAPGARTVKRTIASPQLRRLPALPLPEIEGVRTRRLSGGRLEVRWRMSSDASDTLLSLTATRTRTERRDEHPATDALWGQRRRSYRVVLKDAADKKWVRIEVMTLIGRSKHSATVRLSA